MSSTWSAESDASGAQFGVSVGAAGDVNGDGYGDLIVGAFTYSGDQSNGGQAYLYYGNKGAGLGLNPRQRRADDSAPIAPLGRSDDANAFRLAALGRTPFGRGKVRLEWEVKPLGVRFDGSGLGRSPDWIDTGTAGAALNELVNDLSADTAYHWRVRLRYHPAGSPFQPYSRWLTMPWNGSQEQDFRTGLAETTAPRVITYDYDPLYRLTGADYSTGESFTYAYDAVGNRTEQVRTLQATTVISYVYDAANRLDYFYTDGAPTDLEWDANGNLLTQGDTEYTWDAANRLTGADVDGVVSTFEYDGLGNRTSQTVDGVTTEYVLDVAGGLPEVIVATMGGASTYYVQVQGQILAQHDSETWAYVLPDRLGNVRQLTDPSGQVALAQNYDPFGVLLETAGAGESGFGYTGEQVDAGTGLVFLRARYYDRAMGKFLSKDIVPGRPDSPQSLNGWSYAVNNPISYIDPSGNCIPGVNCPGDRFDELGGYARLIARAYYLNAVENLSGAIIGPNPNPAEEQGYIVYQMGQAIGPENVQSIPIYMPLWHLPLPRGSDTRWQMFGEMIEIRTWSPVVAGAIAEDIATNPLAPGERLIIVGNSGGGTVAIESLDLLKEKGIFVDQVILRGSPILELSLTNVGRVDYITSNFDYYYSFDINPCDDVDVQVHRVDFWWHTLPNDDIRRQVGDLIGDLMLP